MTGKGSSCPGSTQPVSVGAVELCAEHGVCRLTRVHVLAMLLTGHANSGKLFNFSGPRFLTSVVGCNGQHICVWWHPSERTTA